MKVFIPTISTRLRLQQDWTFQLFPESRNMTLFGAFDIPYNPPRWNDPPNPWGKWGAPTVVTLKAGTLISVSRIYIRGSFRDFDSMTFNLIESPDPDLQKGRQALHRDGTPAWWQPKGVRFWVKLGEVNNLEVEVEEKPVPKPRTPRAKTKNA